MYVRKSTKQDLEAVAKTLSTTILSMVQQHFGTTQVVVACNNKDVVVGFAHVYAVATAQDKGLLKISNLIISPSVSESSVDSVGVSIMSSILDSNKQHNIITTASQKFGDSLVSIGFKYAGNNVYVRLGDATAKTAAYLCPLAVEAARPGIKRNPAVKQGPHIKMPPTRKFKGIKPKGLQWSGSSKAGIETEAAHEGETLATAPTMERLIKMISEYFMGSTIHVEGEEVYNAKGLIPSVRVFQKGNRFVFQRKASITDNLPTAEEYSELYTIGGVYDKYLKVVEAQSSAVAKTVAKDVSTMSAAQINTALDKNDEKSHKLNDELIAAGRGDEKTQDTLKKTDPLAIRLKELIDESNNLHREIERRYGPGAPSRLPYGFRYKGVLSDNMTVPNHRTSSLDTRLPHHQAQAKMGVARDLDYDSPKKDNAMFPEEEKEKALYDELLGKYYGDKEGKADAQDSQDKADESLSDVQGQYPAKTVEQPVAEISEERALKIPTIREPKETPLDLRGLSEQQHQVTEFENKQNIDRVLEHNDPVHNPKPTPKNNFERKQVEYEEEKDMLKETQMQRLVKKHDQGPFAESRPGGGRQPQPDSEEGHTHHGAKKRSTMIRCLSCSKEFDYASVPEKAMGSVECPNCKSTINQEGHILHSAEKIKDIWGELVDAPEAQPLYAVGDQIVFPGSAKKEVFTVTKLTTDAIGSEWYYIFDLAPANPMSESRLVNSKVEKQANKSVNPVVQTVRPDRKAKQRQWNPSVAKNCVGTYSDQEKFYDPNSTENEGRKRLRDPKDFDTSTFRRWDKWAGEKAPEGVQFLIGDLLENKGKGCQTIRFDKEVISEEEAEDYFSNIINTKGFEKTWMESDWTEEFPDYKPKKEYAEVTEQDAMAEDPSPKKKPVKKESALEHMTILSFPDLRQTFGYDCGPNALQAILGYYGIDVREDNLIEKLDTDAGKGTEVQGFPAVAEEYGLKTRPVSTVEEIKEAIDQKQPVLLTLQAWTDDPNVDWEKQYDDGHFATAIGYTDEGIIFEDPSSEHRTYLTYEELDKRWHDLDFDNSKLEHWGLAVYGLEPKYNPEERLHMGAKVKAKRIIHQQSNKDVSCAVANAANVMSKLHKARLLDTTCEFLSNAEAGSVQQIYPVTAAMTHIAEDRSSLRKKIDAALSEHKFNEMNYKKLLQQKANNRELAAAYLKADQSKKRYERLIQNERNLD